MTRAEAYDTTLEGWARALGPVIVNTFFSLIEKGEI